MFESPSGGSTSIRQRYRQGMKTWRIEFEVQTNDDVTQPDMDRVCDKIADDVAMRMSDEIAGKSRVSLVDVSD